MTLKLIGASLSPFVRKVRVVLAEKGLAYDHDPMVPFGVSEEYKRLHPLGKIPTLLDGDRVIPDSSAICLYLEGFQPEPALYPSDPYERARAVWLEEFADAGLASAAAAFFQERVLAAGFFKRPADEARVEQAASELLPPLFDYLERQLGDHEYSIGNRFSIADIGLGTQFVNYQLGRGELDAGRWPNLAAYVERVHARPSFKALIDEDRRSLERFSS
jgi:glutathione S-transferase